MTSIEQTAAVPRRPGRPRSETGERSEVAQRLLDAATRLAVEQGFDACGLREIAARADVSSGMIAYYFGDRQGLYEAMFQRAIDRVSDQVATALGDEQRHGHDRLDELVRIHVEAIAVDPWLPKLIISELLAKTDSSVKNTIANQVGQGPMQLMIRWIEEEQARGVLRVDLDARMLAMTIASLSVFPFLMLPVIGAEIGLSLDDEFPARLMEHNQLMLAHGIRARSGKL
ncbi:MAG: TetR/AcrR family transcriptional regulator [Deltaproteobacteria bacterium]|nr:TetR/AcrR family transcriptional regulator [Deltaproteobacteria bacterium]